jgi:hypothetical protein
MPRSRKRPLPIRLHGVVLNYLRTGTTLPFYLNDDDDNNNNNKSSLLPLLLLLLCAMSSLQVKIVLLDVFETKRVSLEHILYV